MDRRRVPACNQAPKESLRNLGSRETVSINQLVDIVEDIAGIKLKRNHNLSAPKGVNGRNSDNTLVKKYLKWEPNIPLRTGP